MARFQFVSVSLLALVSTPLVLASEYTAVKLNAQQRRMMQSVDCKGTPFHLSDFAPELVGTGPGKHKDLAYSGKCAAPKTAIPQVSSGIKQLEIQKKDFTKLPDSMKNIDLTRQVPATPESPAYRRAGAPLVGTKKSKANTAAINACVDRLTAYRSKITDAEELKQFDGNVDYYKGRRTRAVTLRGKRSANGAMACESYEAELRKKFAGH